MEFNKKQIDLLRAIGKQDGRRCLLEIGKPIYKTYRMIHININMFVDFGYVEYETKKNKILPYLTEKGVKLVEKHNTEMFIN